MKRLFSAFKKDNFKTFSSDEDSNKFAIFKQNVMKMVEHNNSGSS